MLSRVEKIQACLEDTFDSIESLQIIDNSHLHAHHKTNTTGGGHYEVTLISKQFNGLSRLQRHQMIYNILAHMMSSEIHALSLHLFSTDDN